MPVWCSMCALAYKGGRKLALAGEFIQLFSGEGTSLPLHLDGHHLATKRTPLRYGLGPRTVALWLRFGFNKRFLLSAVTTVTAIPGKRAHD